MEASEYFDYPKKKPKKKILKSLYEKAMNFLLLI